MRTADFDFDLPEDRIALRPVRPRGAARMLVVKPGCDPILSDRSIADLPAFLNPGDALVFNDTRVIRARLRGRRSRDGATAGMEAMLHMRVDGRRWRAFLRPAKKAMPGDILQFGPSKGLRARVIEKGEGGEALLEFEVEGETLDEALHRHGELPLPPYIASKRPADLADDEDYQTVVAGPAGAVAAPTAGLHLSHALLDELRAQGVSTHKLTLHVGAGTFLPVKADSIDDHRMHAEWGCIDEATAAALNRVRRSGGRLIAVGTTSARLLESAATADGELVAFRGETEIFMAPGYEFKAVDGLLTNFHLPRSTLFMLVSAFAGLKTMHLAYAHAIRGGYRFYSYGDATLLLRR